MIVAEFDSKLQCELSADPAFMRYVLTIPPNEADPMHWALGYATMDCYMSRDGVNMLIVTGVGSFTHPDAVQVV